MIDAQARALRAGKTTEVRDAYEALERRWEALGEQEAKRDLPRLLEAARAGIAANFLAACELHRKDTRWTIPPSEEYRSYDDREEALEDYRGYGLDLTDEQAEAGLRSFDVCAECSRIEVNLAVTNGFDEWAIVQMWPCRTATALGIA